MIVSSIKIINSEIYRVLMTEPHHSVMLPWLHGAGPSCMLGPPAVKMVLVTCWPPFEKGFLVLKEVREDALQPICSLYLATNAAKEKKDLQVDLLH